MPKEMFFQIISGILQIGSVEQQVIFMFMCDQKNICQNLWGLAIPESKPRRSLFQTNGSNGSVFLGGENPWPLFGAIL